MNQEINFVTQACHLLSVNKSGMLTTSVHLDTICNIVYVKFNMKLKSIA